MFRFSFIRQNKPQFTLEYTIPMDGLSISFIFFGTTRVQIYTFTTPQFPAIEAAMEVDIVNLQRKQSLYHSMVIIYKYIHLYAHAFFNFILQYSTPLFPFTLLIYTNSPNSLYLKCNCFFCFHFQDEGFEIQKEMYRGQQYSQIYFSRLHLMRTLIYSLLPNWKPHLPGKPFFFLNMKILFWTLFWSLCSIWRVGFWSVFVFGIVLWAFLCEICQDSDMGSIGCFIERQFGGSIVMGSHTCGLILILLVDGSLSENLDFT